MSRVRAGAVYMLVAVVGVAAFLYIGLAVVVLGNVTDAERAARTARAGLIADSA